MRDSLLGVVVVVEFVTMLNMERNKLPMRCFLHFSALVGIMAVHVGIARYRLMSVER